MYIPWLLCGALLVVVLVLIIKIGLLKKSMLEICADLTEHLAIETNTLISTASRDKHIRRLAAEMNKQLSLLRKQRQRYINGNGELQEAITNISHDLRTPLTAIYGYLELLAQEESTQTAKRYVEIITERMETMKLLTEELFRYTVVVTDESSAHKAPVVINDVLAESIAGFYAVLNAHEIMPKIQISAHKVIRILNRSALSRVFSNLLNNAILHSDGDLEITLSEAGEITFTNTASALNKVQVGKLFDRYYTVEAAQKSTGLGLAISRTLIEQMQGRISASYENSKLRIDILFSEK